MAVRAALKVWPNLRSNMVALGIDPTIFDSEERIAANSMDHDDADESSYEWLLQKLSALASITQQGNSADAMLGCDAVLLVRVLLEEQMLDGGRSNGRGGKYGGKFHPSSSNALLADDNDGGERSKVGSRPLTVGELYANWHELRDVTRTRYPFVEEGSDGKMKRKDPLPEIRECLKEQFRDGQSEVIVPSWQSLAHDVLFDYQGESIGLRQNAVLLLGHDAQIPLALRSLYSLGYHLDVDSDLEVPDYGNTARSGDEKSMKVAVSTADGVARRRPTNGLLLAAPDAEREETHSAMIRRIIAELDDATQKDIRRNIFVIHSSLEVLKECKSFLTEDAPMLSHGLRTCYPPHTKSSVTLCLPKWADNIHPTQRNDGEMDPWLNLISEEQLLELISARIVTQASLA